MKYTTIIFDMDGTILDTLEDMKRAINAALVESGFSERTLNEVRRFVGNGNHRLVERAVPEDAGEEAVETVFRAFHRYYKVYMAEHTAPYEGILPLLIELREAGAKLAVVSNKADYGVKDLNETYFRGLFLEAVGERDGIRRKPAPDAVLAVMESLGALPEETVYIGDSEVDIETARNAGIPCISVTWGFRAKDFLTEHGASQFADTMEELRTLLLEK